MKVAVCLWGICRSTPYVIDSFKKNILGPLNTFGFQVTIFLHTYIKDKAYTNKRAGETNLILDPSGYCAFKPDMLYLEKEDDARKSIKLERFRTHPDPWDTNYQTFDNHLFALWSLKRVTEMVKPGYDVVLYCRPDVLYLNPLRFEWFSPSRLANIQLPDFHKFPINDRFAICNPAHAQLFGKRYDGAYEYSLKNKLHSEQYLNYVLTQAKVKIQEIPMRFQRIRADGRNQDKPVAPPT